MHFTSSVYVQWAGGAALEVLVLALALKRKLFHRCPILTGYFALVVATEIVAWSAYHLRGFRAQVIADAIWIMMAIQLVARACSIFEICSRVLSPYAGVWKFSRWILFAAGALLLGSTELAAKHSGPHLTQIIFAGERGLELAIVSVLALALIFCRYYRIRIQPFLKWILFGFGFYSAVQVANNTFLGEWLTAYFPLWEGLRHISYNLATVCWCVALWKPLPEQPRAPVMLEPHVYEELSPAVNLRLRRLNSRLLEMLK